MSPQNEDPEVLEEAAVVRRPYEGPAIVESAVFETLALACGKTSGVAFCDLIGPLSSS